MCTDYVPICCDRVLYTIAWVPESLFRSVCVCVCGGGGGGGPNHFFEVIIVVFLLPLIHRKACIIYLFIYLKYRILKVHDFKIFMIKFMDIVRYWPNFGM